MATDALKPLPLEALALQPMASGRLCLELTERVGWQDFPRYAADLLRALSGHKVRAIDSPDVRLWEVLLGGHPLRLVYDDFPVMITLESDSSEADDLLRELHASLQSKRSR